MQLKNMGLLYNCDVLVHLHNAIDVTGYTYPNFNFALT